MIVDPTKSISEISVEGFYVKSVKWILACLNPTVTLDTEAIVRHCNQPATEVCNISPFSIPIPETYAMNATFTLYNPQLGAMKDYIKSFTFTIIKNNYVKASIDRYSDRYSPQDLVFSGRNSYDPNINMFQFFNLVSKSMPNNGLAYAWTLTLSPPSGTLLTSSTEEFSIPATSLTIGNSYTVTLTVSKDTRTNSKSFTFIVVDPAVVKLPLCGLSVETKPFSNLYKLNMAEREYTMSSKNPTIEIMCQVNQTYSTLENKITYDLSTPAPTLLGSNAVTVSESLLLSSDKHIASFSTQTFLDGTQVSKTTFELSLDYPVNSTYIRFLPGTGTEFKTLFNVRFLVDLNNYFVTALNIELTFVDTYTRRDYLLYKGNSLGEKLVYLPQGSGYLMLGLFDGKTWLGNSYSTNLTVLPATPDDIDTFVANIWNIDDKFRGNYMSMLEEIYAGQYTEKLLRLGKRDLTWGFSRSFEDSKLTMQSSMFLLRKYQESLVRALDKDWTQEIHPLFESSNDLTSEILLSSSIATLADPWRNNTQNLEVRNSTRDSKLKELLESLDLVSSRIPHSSLLASLSSLLSLSSQQLSQMHKSTLFEGNSFSFLLLLTAPSPTLQNRTLRLGTEAVVSLATRDSLTGTFWMRAVRGEHGRPFALFVPITPVVEFGYTVPGTAAGSSLGTTALTSATSTQAFTVRFAVSRYDALRRMGGESADVRYTYACLALDKLKKVYRTDLCKTADMTAASAEFWITCECVGADHVLAGYIKKSNLVMPGTEVNTQMPNRGLEEIVTSEFFFSSVYLFYVTVLLCFFVIGASILVYVDITNPPFYSRAELETSFLQMVKDYNRTEETILEYENSEEQRLYIAMQRRARAKVLGESTDDSANLHHAMVAYEADKKIERIKKKFGLTQKKQEEQKEKDKFSEYGIVDTDRTIQSDDEVDQLRDEDEEELDDKQDPTKKKRRKKEERTKEQEAIYIGELESSEEEFLDQYNNTRSPAFFRTILISFIINHSFFGMFLDNASNEPKYIQYSAIWVRVFASYCFVSAFNSILSLADCSPAFYIMSFMWVMLATQISFNSLRALISFYIQKRLAANHISSVQPQPSPNAGAASPSLPKRKPQSKLFVEVGIFLLFLNLGLYLVCLVKDVGITKRQLHTIINHHLIVIPTEFIFAEFLVLCCRFFFLVLLLKFPDSKDSTKKFIIGITPSQMLLTVSDLLNLPSALQLKYSLLLKDTRS